MYLCHGPMVQRLLYPSTTLLPLSRHGCSKVLRLLIGSADAVLCSLLQAADRVVGTAVYSGGTMIAKDGLLITWFQWNTMHIETGSSGVVMCLAL